MSSDFIDTDDATQKLVMRWTMAGHEVIPERLLFRHKGMRKDFPPDALLRFSDGLPVISCGKAVKIADMLPERADIALDSDGKLLSDTEFEKRYREYLRWFQFVENSDVDVEPVPNSLDYALGTPDTFGESNGFVAINFDARMPAPAEPTHLYDNLADKFVAIEDIQNTTLEAVKVLLEKSTRGPGRPRKEDGEN